MWGFARATIVRAPGQKTSESLSNMALPSEGQDGSTGFGNERHSRAAAAVGT